MRFYIYLFFCFVCLLAACDEPDIPRDVIPKKDMSALLTDIHIVDGSLFALSPAADTLVKYGLAKYMAVFREHHTDSATFRKSMRFYTTRPDMLLDIYNDVKTNIRFKMDSLRKIDSLNTVRAMKKAKQVKIAPVVTKNAVPLK